MWIKLIGRTSKCLVIKAEAIEFVDLELKTDHAGYPGGIPVIQLGMASGTMHEFGGAEALYILKRLDRKDAPCSPPVLSPKGMAWWMGSFEKALKARKKAKL